MTKEGKVKGITKVADYVLKFCSVLTLLKEYKVCPIGIHSYNTRPSKSRQNIMLKVCLDGNISQFAFNLANAKHEQFFYATSRELQQIINTVTIAKTHNQHVLAIGSHFR